MLFLYPIIQTNYKKYKNIKYIKIERPSSWVRVSFIYGQSESVAQPTHGTSSGTDSATIPPVLTEQDIPGAALNTVN